MYDIDAMQELLKDLYSKGCGAKYFSEAIDDGRNSLTEDSVTLDSIEVMLRRMEDDIKGIRAISKDMKEEIMKTALSETETTENK